MYPVCIPINHSSFPGGTTTYLPTGLTEQSVRAFGRGRYEPIQREIAGKAPESYERVGVDRALAIAVDLAADWPVRRLQILDVGCSTGLMSKLLNACGYAVTGIDRNTAPRQCERLRILQIELTRFLAEHDESFDVVLLLNGLHWFPTQEHGLPADIEELCRRARSHLYIEAPLSIENEEFCSTDTLLRPHALVDHGVGKRIRWIATTIASDAKSRRLYRVDVK
jgi:SAM-dependent methyltransferase